jgi:hypothetical protein
MVGLGFQGETSGKSHERILENERKPFWLVWSIWKRFWWVTASVLCNPWARSWSDFASRSERKFEFPATLPIFLAVKQIIVYYPAVCINTSLTTSLGWWASAEMSRTIQNQVIARPETARIGITSLKYEDFGLFVRCIWSTSTISTR